MAVETELAVPLPEIRMVSMAVLPQYLSAPALALSCSMKLGGAGVLLLGEGPLCAPVGMDTGNCHPPGSQSRCPGLSLHNWTGSFPRAQILGQAAVWSECAFSDHPVLNGKCSESAASRIRLSLLLLLASQHMHTPRAWSLGFTSPSVCPSGPLAVKEACLLHTGTQDCDVQVVA